MEFSAKEIIALFQKHLLLVIICTLAGLSIFFVITSYVIKPSYTASAQLYVDSQDTADTADINDLYYAQKVVNTYISFLQTKVFYQRVLEEGGFPYTTEQLRKMTEIIGINNTEIFQISVTTNDAINSYELVSVMQRIAPELIQGIMSKAQISVVDPAVIPEAPSAPNILLNTATGGVIGFLLALLFTFLWEMIDVKVKNSEELKKYSRPILGEIPDYGARSRKRPKILTLLKLKSGKQAISHPSVADESNKFMISEAYKSLRANLRYTLPKEGCRKILINSPVSMEGKSTVCASIGIAIAQTGAKVLLVDCDLRKGRLHNIFKLKSNPGVSDLLSGLANDKVVVQDTGYENLHVISMGTVPPNPAELLSSEYMEQLILYQEKLYDYIIIDSAPVNLVADTLGLLKLVDGIIMVVRQNYSSHPSIVTALTKYELIGANILGFVLNGIETSQDNKYKSQYYAYKNQHD